MVKVFKEREMKEGEHSYIIHEAVPLVCVIQRRIEGLLFTAEFSLTARACRLVRIVASDRLPQRASVWILQTLVNLRAIPDFLVPLPRLMLKL